MPSRLANALLIGLILSLWAHAIYLASGMPTTVASAFAFDGHAEGFMSRSAHLTIWTLLMVVIPVVLGLLPIERLTAGGKFLDIPNKAHWLSPAHRDQTLAMLQSFMRVFAAMLAVGLAALHFLVAEANRSAVPHLPANLHTRGVGLFVAATMVWAVLLWWRLPETLAQKRPDALRLGPWLAAMRTVSAHTGFRAWTALSSFTYGGLFVLLAGSSFVYIGGLGLAPWAYGAVMAVGSLSYIAGTFLCRRLLLRHGLLGTVWRGAFATAAGGLGLLGLALSGQKAAWPVMVAHWVYTFGHGIHQPCGQTASVGAFPQMAGVASALSGFVLAATAFATGLWLGQAMDGSVLVLASGLCFFAALTSLTAWTVVQRFGQLPQASAS
ncbi:MAG: hypothetical protein C4K60_16870 [Ideonella sp. MAG2]|nr:MAG: hypothetical protein C4K60_16870 [Ideonella sp. MAG2]